MKNFKLTNWVPLPLLIASFIMIWLLTACGPTSKMRRAEKLIARAEQQGAKWHSDTIRTVLEIPVPEVVKDTIFQPVPGDTVKIDKERLSIRYVQLPGGKVYIKGECKTDTIFKEVVTTINKEIKCPEKKSWFKWWHLVIAFIIGGAAFKLWS